MAVVQSGILHRETLLEFPTEARSDPETFVSVLVQCAGRMIAGEPQVMGIGVAVPGFLDAGLSSVVYAPNTPALAGFPLRRALTCAVGVKVALEVDCNAAALAEYHCGGGQHVPRLLVLTLGTGVGGGMVVSGKPVRITGGCCGDIGHIYVGGKQRCSAGCKGCLESAICSAALARAAGSPEGCCGAAVHRLISQAVGGDEACRAILSRGGEAVGIAAASLSSFLRPDLVLLAGGISEAGDLLTEPANEAMRAYSAPYFTVPIRKGVFGAHGALTGAAISFLNQRKYLP